MQRMKDAGRGIPREDEGGYGDDGGVGMYTVSGNGGNDYRRRGEVMS